MIAFFFALHLVPVHFFAPGFNAKISTFREFLICNYETQ
jgi:hypothetical protein